jgi:outer membrane murein-binding lipoprotein Lpp
METQVQKLQRELRELRDAIEVARQAQSAATNNYQRAVNKMDEFLQVFYIKEIIRILDEEKAAKEKKK